MGIQLREGWGWVRLCVLGGAGEGEGGSNLANAPTNTPSLCTGHVSAINNLLGLLHSNVHDTLRRRHSLLVARGGVPLGGVRCGCSRNGG